jgi:hypothetical protein
MKKVSIIFFVIILFISCDPPADYDYFIINQCDEKIDVYIESNSKTKSNLQISPNATQLIYSNDRTILPLEDRMIEYFFEEIMIVKGSDTSKVNYINKDLWDFRETSKGHADSYLTITPKDFE